LRGTATLAAPIGSPDSEPQRAWIKGDIFRIGQLVSAGEVTVGFYPHTGKWTSGSGYLPNLVRLPSSWGRRRRRRRRRRGRRWRTWRRGRARRWGSDWYLKFDCSGAPRSRVGSIGVLLIDQGCIRSGRREWKVKPVIFLGWSNGTNGSSRWRWNWGRIGWRYRRNKTIGRNVH